MQSFIKMNRWEEIDNMILEYPNAFILITVIARRARRIESKILWLNIWECFIWDHENYGMTRSQYRRSQQKLEEWWFCSFKTTNKGTTASLISDVCYCINADQQNDQRETNDEPTRDQRETTNKEWKNERQKEWKIISSKEDRQVTEKKEYWDPIINSIIDTIKFHNNWIIDWTIQSNRKHWKMLRDKIWKITGFSWDYVKFLSTLIERID